MLRKAAVFSSWLLLQSLQVGVALFLAFMWYQCIADMIALGEGIFND